MKFFKENWAFVVIAIVCLAVGVLALLTAFKVGQNELIAPTAPNLEHAQEDVSSCSRSLTIDTTGKKPLSASDSALFIDDTAASSSATPSSKLKIDSKSASVSATPSAKLK